MKTLVVDGRPEDQEFKVTLVYTESWMKMRETNESSSWQANIVIRIFTSIINPEFDKQLPLSFGLQGLLYWQLLILHGLILGSVFPSLLEVRVAASGTAEVLCYLKRN